MNDTQETTDRPFRNYATLGRTNLRVSRLGIGAGYGAPAAAYEKAFHEHRVNYFYWSLPRRGNMRQALSNLTPSHREELVIALQTYDHFGFLGKGSIERQLRKLNLDYADVMILGWFNRYPPKGLLEAAAQLKAEGKIRHVCMSGHKRSFFAQLAQEPDCPIDIFMIRYNAAHPGAEKDIFPYLPETNRPGIYTYTTTSWGQLLNPKRMPPGEPPMTSTDCYRFALSNPNVNMCLCGPKTGEEMDLALKTLDSPATSDEEMARFRRIGAYVHSRGKVAEPANADR